MDNRSCCQLTQVLSPTFPPEPPPPLSVSVPFLRLCPFSHATDFVCLAVGQSDSLHLFLPLPLLRPPLIVLRCTKLEFRTSSRAAATTRVSVSVSVPLIPSPRTKEAEARHLDTDNATDDRS